MLPKVHDDTINKNLTNKTQNYHSQQMKSHCWMTNTVMKSIDELIFYQNIAKTYY